MKHDNLLGTRLWNAIHESANLKCANYGGAGPWGAALTNTNLYSAFLVETNLTVANRAAADLTKANFGGTTLEEVALSGAAGLKLTVHWIPSKINQETLKRTAEGFSRSPSNRTVVRAFLQHTGSQPYPHPPESISHRISC